MTVKVRLLVDMAEGGRDLAKARAAADAFGLGKNDPKYPRLKETNGPRGYIEYRVGTVVDTTTEGAAKLIERGVAQAVA